MIYVLAVSALTLLLVGSTVVVASSNIVPGVRTAYAQAADAAAQGGLQAFIAYVDKYCDSGNVSVASCTLPTNYSGTVQIHTYDGTAGSYAASYSWYAVKDPSNRYFRVSSTGTATQNNLTMSKTVVGDVAGGASLNIYDYGVVTGFESQSSATVLADWPRRTIALDSSAIAASGVPIKKNSITWSGSSPGTAAGKVAICNATYEDKGGRSNNLPTNAPNPYVDWTESGLNGNNYTNFQPCQTSWGTNTQLLPPLNPADGPGGYFSNDAILVSNSYPGGTGPLFNQPVVSWWRYQASDAGLCSTTPGLNYRSFNLQCAGYPVEVGGTPNSSSKYPYVAWGKGPAVPASTPVIPANACVYTGPTRVLLQGDTAIVTSPQTTQAWVAANAASRPPQCYSGAGALGMAGAPVSLTNPTLISVIQTTNNGKVPPTTPAVAHGSSGWPLTGQRLGDTASTSNSVFYVSQSPATAADPNTATAADACSATATYTGATASSSCQWSNASNDVSGSSWTPDGTGWTTYSSGPPCTTAPTDRTTFSCEYNGGTYSTGQYKNLRGAVQTALAAATTSVATTGSFTVGGQTYTCTSGTITPSSAGPDQLACLLMDKLHQANTGGKQPGYTPVTTGDHRYVVSYGTTTTSTPVTQTVGGTPSTGMSGDSFFRSTTGTASTETVTTKTTTFTIGRQVASSPTQWGDGTTANASVPQFQVKITQYAYSNFAQGTTAVSRFPSMSDVTQYEIGTSGVYGASGPGDLYTEGTTNHTVALVAQNDVIITNNLTAANITAATVEVVGQNNVHVYHPVKCRITDATMIKNTDPGFCPDDITGLYTTAPPSGWYPYQQYVNLLDDNLNNLTVNGAVFALGNAPQSITCPQPPNGGGVCGGELTVDNFDRGSSMGHINFVGTIAMAHHAPFGKEWEIPDQSGQSGRAYSGYQLAQRYQNLGVIIASVADVQNLLETVSATSQHWHIVSVSTGSGS